MDYISAKRKLELLVITALLYNILVVAGIVVLELSDMQQTIDNLATCQQGFPEESWQLCFNWLQDLTGMDLAYSWILGGNASIYLIYRLWNAGQYDSQIRRLMGQTRRISCKMPNSYVSIIADDGWVGGLTYRCQELYDDYVTAVTGYNAGSLTAKELQQSAKKLFEELTKTYGALEKLKPT